MPEALPHRAEIFAGDLQLPSDQVAAATVHEGLPLSDDLHERHAAATGTGQRQGIGHGALRQPGAVERHQHALEAGRQCRRPLRRCAPHQDRHRRLPDYGVRHAPTQPAVLSPVAVAPNCDGSDAVPAPIAHDLLGRIPFQEDHRGSDTQRLG